jgi:hypothetical protein
MKTAVMPVICQDLVFAFPRMNGAPASFLSSTI